MDYEIGRNVALPIQYYEKNQDFTIAPYGYIVNIQKNMVVYKDSNGNTWYFYNKEVPSFEFDDLDTPEITCDDNPTDRTIKRMLKVFFEGNEVEIQKMLRDYVYDDTNPYNTLLSKRITITKAIIKYEKFMICEDSTEDEILTVDKNCHELYLLQAKLISAKEYEENLEEEAQYMEYEETIRKQNDTNMDTFNSGFGNTSADRNPMKYFVNMTVEAKKHPYDEAYNVESIVEDLVVNLLKKDNCNVLLKGKQGCGKTSIVEQLANLMAQDKVPGLKGKEILKLDITALISNCSLRGMFEERMKIVMDYMVKNKEKYIIFIDEIHRVIGTNGGKDDSASMANMMKESITKNTSIIGATTIDEYNKLSEGDKAFVRRFTKKNVEELPLNLVREVMKKEKPKYEKFHGIKVSYELIDAVIAAYDPKVVDTSLIDFTKSKFDEICSYIANIKLNEVQAYRRMIASHLVDMDNGNTYVKKAKLGFGDKEEMKLSEEVRKAIEKLEITSKILKEKNIPKDVSI